MRLQRVLQKTIVFITHDFDEAIRLADRIAIMKDGEIIQIGTPEELVMQPGDRLRRRIHPRRAARQGDLGAQPDAACEPAPSMAARSRRMPRSRASRRRSSPPSKPFAVVNGTGKPIGEVTPQAVIDLLAGIERRGARA